MDRGLLCLCYYLQVLGYGRLAQWTLISLPL